MSLLVEEDEAGRDLGISAGRSAEVEASAGTFRGVAGSDQIFEEEAESEARCRGTEGEIVARSIWVEGEASGCDWAEGMIVGDETALRLRKGGRFVGLVETLISGDDTLMTLLLALSSCKAASGEGSVSATWIAGEN